MGNNINSKEKIIKIASNLFEVKGYKATGLNEILRESGAAKGSLYYYFPNGKEELALDAIRLAGEKITDNLKKTLYLFENPVDGIIANINNMAEIIDNDKKMHDMSISLIALETYDSSEILRIACEKVFKEIEKIYIQKFINYGINEDKAKDLGATISALIEGAIMLSLTRKNGSNLRKIRNSVKILLEN